MKKENIMPFDLGNKAEVCTHCFNGFITLDTRICNNCQKFNRPAIVITKKVNRVTYIDHNTGTVTIKVEDN
jgi:hypothetical protein